MSQNEFTHDLNGFLNLARNIDISQYSNDLKKEDPDGLVALVSEVSNTLF